MLFPTTSPRVPDVQAAAVPKALRQIAVAAIALGMAACGQCRDAAIPAAGLGVTELLAKADCFEGRDVTVRGVAVIVFEGTSLYPSMDLAEKTTEAGVWLGLGYVGYKDYLGFHGKFVRIEGKFHSGPTGHFGLWPGAIWPVETISVVPAKDGGKVDWSLGAGRR